MKLSTKSTYALEGLLYLAVSGGDRPLSIKDIAAEIQASPAYMEQIFIKLKKAGLVDTQRGSNGGFFLTCREDEVTVNNVIQAVEGSTVPVRCVESASACTSRARQHCVSRRVWVRVSRAISDITESLTLASLKEQYLKETGGAAK